MKSFFHLGFLLGITWMLGSQMAFAVSSPSATNDGLVIRYVDAKGAPILRANTTLPDVIRLNGTGAEATITVSATGLTQDITLRVGPGFEVAPATIAAGTEAAKVTVRHTSSRNHTDGRLILRSGDIRTYVAISAEGTPLPVRDILAATSLATAGTPSSAVSVFDGLPVESQSFDAAALSDAGYTIEIKARTDDPSKSVLPYAVTASGLGFKSYVRSTSMGLMNGKNVFVSEKGLSNPANGGTFYNTDGLFHTYRYAVTPDRRIFVYRDGLPIDTFRVADLALQPEWSETNGNMLPNLIKNGDFEGEYNFSESQNITKFIEGWDVYPYDQYNSYQDIEREERSNEIDQNNHVLSIHRYMWNDGWADAEISQIVDVAPNETYAFSALAKGGQYSGSALGSIRIQDLQNDANNVRLNVTSDTYQTYAADFATQANTKQVRVTFQLGRAKWGASVSAFKVDDVKMTGMSRIPTAQVGFENLGADIQYFAIDPTGAYAPPFATLATNKDALIIKGTGASGTFTVSAANLTGDISLTATHGFEVSPKVIKAGTQNATVTVKHLTTLIENTGRIILRSGDLRKEVKLTAYGSPLDVKDISTTGYPFNGADVESQSFSAEALSDAGYTIEIKARTDDPSKSVLPYAVTPSGLGFKSYVRSTSMGLMNGKNVFVSEKGLSNPANGGTFYNTDGLFHTYRYAVTPDRRIFVYRDGLPIDTFRVADLALQPEWSETNGNMLPNLIRNGDFEGEHNFSSSQNITKFIEGWDVYPYDQYNSYQDIDREERSNEVDQNNHVLSIHRYMWNDGWADAEISQIVDVAPNETYAFSALAKGGQYSGSALGSIRIQDLQNDNNNVRLNVTSDTYQTYAADFATQANTKQVRVTFQLGRAKWGASVSAFKVDDVKMTGMSRIPTAQVGFENLGADIQYFAIDPTGAYAPPFAAITTSTDALVINGTGASKTFTVSAENLTGDITLTATHGFEVSPATLPVGTQNTTVTVKHLTTLIENTGRIILRSGDVRKEVKLTAYGDVLPVKDISTTGYTFNGADVESQSFSAEALSDAGYTIEIKARTDDPSKSVLPYAVTTSGLGFKSYVRSTSMGLMNGKNVFVSEKGLSNPTNGGTFYNTDGLFHTYRYAVTPDRRIFVYRDGLPIDTFRVADLALQPEWSETNGNMLPNLIRNGDFEGEYNFSESQNITKFIEGWDVYPYDQYNSYQDIDREERSNEVDQNNHVLSIHRYMWNDGWADAEISQIVDVAPNETYAFSALAKGGQYSGSALGSIRIQDLQNDANNVRLNVTSDTYQTYAADFATQANTKQVRVTFQLGRAKWGASTSAFKVDDVRMTGMSRIPTAQVGFENLGADIQYFAIDPTGAYAPPFATLATNKDALIIKGTGASGTFTVSAANLTGDISLTATHGFEVSPKVIKAGTQNATVTVRHLTTLIENTGRIILRSGDVRKEVKLTAYGDVLPVKDISTTGYTFNGADVESQSFSAEALSDAGYTIEIKARTDDPSKSVLPYAVTPSGLGFKSYVRSTSMGLMNGKNVFVSEKGLSNPANGGTFYNTDGLFHTYRYAVTPDRRIFVYRDGMPIDTFRVADLALQPEWSETNGPVKKNLLKNGNFEGEYNFSESQNITKFIEGWDVYPYDQYNSYQDIDREERSNEVDQKNHVLSIHRYMWNDGWADAEISQIVDVASDDIYTFSALAKGGQYNGSALGSIRIQDLQNDDNNARLNVTSDNYDKYSVDFETRANTKQIRITFQLGRAKWGASTSAFKIDDARLVGTSRIPTAQVGFENLGADIEYFAIDASGAYAPVLPGLTVKDIQNAIQTARANDGTFSGRIISGQLYLRGVEDHARVVIYEPSGQEVVAINDYTGQTAIALPRRGIYIVAVFKDGKKKVIKVM